MHLNNIFKFLGNVSVFTDYNLEGKKKDKKRDKQANITFFNPCKIYNGIQQKKLFLSKKKQ